MSGCAFCTFVRAAKAVYVANTLAVGQEPTYAGEIAASVKAIAQWGR